MSCLIQVNNISKSYNKLTVLKNISINFESGKIYGLIGRNGSGKTLLMKCICGLISVTSGSILINGSDISKRSLNEINIGAIIEQPGFLPNLSGYQNLKILAKIKNIIGDKEIRKAMNLVGLDSDSRKKAGKHSLGMKQRLGIAQAIMENQQILLLDEPMNGLDNSTVETIREIIAKLQKEGKTIIIATHYKEDIEILCDEVIELDNGCIINHIIKNNNHL